MNVGQRVSTRLRITAPLAIALSAIVAPDIARGQDESRNKSDATSTLASMLSLAPVLGAPAEIGQTVLFADIAAQLAAAGLTPPDSIEDNEALGAWIQAISPLGLASPFGTRALQLNRSLLGFDATDVDQTIELGEPPEMVTLLRGRFDHDAIAAGWKSQGYAMLDLDGIAVASLAEDASIDLDKEINQLALARMNNAALLPDGTLVYTTTLPLMQSVIDVANGVASSLAERPDIAALLAAAPDELASAMLFSGGLLAVQEQLPPQILDDPSAIGSFHEEIDATGTISPIVQVLAGITPGGPATYTGGSGTPLAELPPAQVVFRALLAGSGAAASAVGIVDKRLESLDSATTGAGYGELFASWDVRSEQDAPVLDVDLTLAEDVTAGIWLQLIFRRDLLFLAW